MSSKKILQQLPSKLSTILSSSMASIGKRKPRRRPQRRQFRRTLPASYITSLRPRYSIVSRGANSVRVSGVDLVYAMPDVVTASNVGIFSIIPANPAYWTGTKIAKLAGAYMNYRPIHMRFSYVPQVAVTQQGTVYMGTFWNGASALPNLQQSLVSSNGGTTTPCYSPKDTTISLGTSLPQNLFTMCGPLGPDTLPFLFVAGVAGADVVPGYFYVTYVFEFKNPVGDAWRYSRTDTMSFSDMPPRPTHQNASVVLLSSSGRFGPGTILDFENSGLYYHGSNVKLDPTTMLMLFYNDQSEIDPIQPDPSKIVYFRTNLDSAVHMISEFTLIKEGGAMPSRGISITNPQPNGLVSIIYGAQNSVAASDRWVYPLTDIPGSVQFFDQSGTMVFQDITDRSDTISITPNWIQTSLLPGFPPPSSSSSSSST